MSLTHFSLFSGIGGIDLAAEAAGFKMCIRDSSGAIAYNILTDRKDIIKPIGFHRESTALNDTDMKYLLLYLEETYGLTNEKKIDNAIGIVANEMCIRDRENAVCLLCRGFRLSG